jgi:hypothetical protein
VSVGVRGALPRLPITFSANASGGRVSNDMPIRAVLPATLASDSRSDATAMSESRVGSGNLDLYYAPTAALRANVSYRQSHNDGSNLGVGGLVLREAGFASAFDNRDVRAGVSRFGSRFAYEGGIVATMMDSSTRANADDLGLVVGGDAILGGAFMTASRSARTRWTAKQVMRNTGGHPWSVGIVAAGSIDRSQQTPNAHGLFQVESIEAYEQAREGQPAGTWMGTRGAGDARYASLQLSPFAQTTIVRAANVEINGGLRADYQSDFGTFVSPRASFAARARGFTIGGGAGVFALPVSSAVFMRAIEHDGVHLQQFVATAVSLDEAATVSASRVPGIRSALASDLARPHELMERMSIERPIGRFVPGVEATWTQGRHLLGSARAIDGPPPASGVRPGWVDTFESDRRADRLRLHAQARYSINRNMVAGHYEWVHARDNTDGPFSYAADSRNPDAEWSRSAGSPAHTITATGSFALPKMIALSVTDSWNSGTPYTITTGLDAGGNGLFIDRGGLPRNSGDGPAYHSLSLYGSRRIALPDAVAHGRIHVNLGVQADNILDNTNYLSVGSVLNSPSFGRPLAAMPGRSVRVFLNLD